MSKSSGQIYVWEGGTLLVGRGEATTTDVHSHHAVQVALRAEGVMRFRTGDSTEWGEFDGVVIATRQPHAMQIERAMVAHIFVEPVSAEGRALATLHPPGIGIVPVPAERQAEAARAIFGAWAETRSRERMIAATERAIAALTAGAAPRRAVDPRIARAVTYVKANLDKPTSLEAAADAATLSPSRFRHLFVEETGMAFRPYVLWLRFLRAWEVIASGETLTTAAHIAGFADSAHLSRTSRRMFGIAPSDIGLER